MVNQIINRNKEQDKKEEEECNPIPNSSNPSKINSEKNKKWEWGVIIHRTRMIINRKMITRKINHNNNLNHNLKVKKVVFCKIYKIIDKIKRPKIFSNKSLLWVKRYNLLRLQCKNPLKIRTKIWKAKDLNQINPIKRIIIQNRDHKVIQKIQESILLFLIKEPTLNSLNRIKWIKIRGKR